ncbi:SDR family oxidoreductase [Ferrimonas aestuarii]|uniref:SDR family oxidoreductase n=1 Tax=Ferrimonas aestuarii TaxID=2569539 RepID=A0A4U1BT25_9GAMM|nr:SDR family oxidoreductase [Ferrimonas aestuarii]TKB58322.1 SDR family oxidoreductase [Ferrimonas aestuarii]
MGTVLITGANRGLGLEFVRQYVASGHQVLACCRNPQSATALTELATESPQVELLALDVTDETQINQLAKQLHGRAIDILINNAGVLGEQCAELGKMTQADWLSVLTINTVAPALMIQAFASHVAASEQKTIVGISTRVASIEDNGSGGMYSYRASKAALNQILKSAANNLQAEGVKTLAIHPGWVQTDMGGENATFTPQQSVSGMIAVIDQLTPEASGSFKVFDGSDIPW